MLDRLFARFTAKDEAEPQDNGHDTLAHAVAALLVEAACADDDYTDIERDTIGAILAKQFSLNADAAEAVLAKAETAQAEANDLYQFSRVVKDELDREGKMKLVEDMWRVVLTDNARDPHEEMVIRRLIGLIHLEDRDSTEARRRAEAAQ